MLTSVNDGTRRWRDAAFAMKHQTGSLLVKKYDKTYRRLVVGKWVLYDANGVCIGQSKFFDKPKCPPPIEWAEKKLKEQEFLKKHGF